MEEDNVDNTVSPDKGGSECTRENKSSIDREIMTDQLLVAVVVGSEDDSNFIISGDKVGNNYYHGTEKAMVLEVVEA